MGLDDKVMQWSWNVFGKSVRKRMISAAATVLGTSLSYGKAAAIVTWFTGVWNPMFSDKPDLQIPIPLDPATLTVFLSALMFVVSDQVVKAIHFMVERNKQIKKASASSEV